MFLSSPKVRLSSTNMTVINTRAEQQTSVLIQPRRNGVQPIEPHMPWTDKATQSTRGSAVLAATQLLRTWCRMEETVAYSSSSIVYACIAVWIINSAICVLLNKHVLYYLDFKFPTTLAVMHMVSAALATAVLIHATPDGRQRRLPPRGAARPRFYAQLAGIAALFGIVLVLANSAFMYLSVPSIQMLKVGAQWGRGASMHQRSLQGEQPERTSRQTCDV